MGDPLPGCSWQRRVSRAVTGGRQPFTRGDADGATTGLLMTAGARLRSLIAGAAAALMATGLVSLGAVQAAPSAAAATAPRVDLGVLVVTDGNALGRGHPAAADLGGRAGRRSSTWQLTPGGLPSTSSFLSGTLRRRDARRATSRASCCPTTRPSGLSAGRAERAGQLRDRVLGPAGRRLRSTPTGNVGLKRARLRRIARRLGRRP